MTMTTYTSTADNAEIEPLPGHDIPGFSQIEGMPNFDILSEDFSRYLVNGNDLWGHYSPDLEWQKKNLNAFFCVYLKGISHSKIQEILDGLLPGEGNQSINIAYMDFRISELEDGSATGRHVSSAIRYLLSGNWVLPTLETSIMLANLRRLYNKHIEVEENNILDKGSQAYLDKYSTVVRAGKMEGVSTVIAKPIQGIISERKDSQGMHILDHTHLDSGSEMQQAHKDIDDDPFTVSSGASSLKKSTSRESGVKTRHSTSSIGSSGHSPRKPTISSGQHSYSTTAVMETWQSSLKKESGKSPAVTRQTNTGARNEHTVQQSPSKELRVGTTL